MRSLQEIIVNNRNVQLEHFRTSFETAKKLLTSGFTMDAYGNVVQRNTGFAVAIKSYPSLERLIRSAWFKNDGQVPLDVDEIDFYFGYWKDSTGMEYFEVSRIYKDSITARDVAAHNKQKAIYSFADKTDIVISLEGRI